MKVIEIKHEDKEVVCRSLYEAKEALERAMYKLKEAEVESDTRMWTAQGDYRYHSPEKSYRDDFRYRY